MSNVLLEQVTFENYSDFIVHMRGSTSEPIMAGYKIEIVRHLYEIPFFLKGGGSYNPISAVVSVTTLIDGSQPPTREEYQEDKDFEADSNLYKTITPFEEAKTKAEELMADELNRLVALYGFVYFSS